MLEGIINLFSSMDLRFYYNCLIMVLSIAGAILASSATSKSRGWGFLIWIVSNGAIAIGFAQQQNWPMAATFVMYEILNVRGLRNNWFIKEPK